MTNKYGYIAPVIKEGDLFHEEMGDVASNPSGSWAAWLPNDEDEIQDSNGFETEACVSEATTHSVETVAKQKYSDTTEYSDRYLATASGTGEKQGNDIGTVTETFAEGCPQESDYPFKAKSYEDFYKTLTAGIKALAKAQIADYSFKFPWVTDTSPEGMMSALAFSPLMLSVFAWPEPDAQGIYHRPPGAPDCHQIEVYDYDHDNHQYWCIFDSYDQTHKKLAWDYGFGAGKRVSLTKVVPTSPTPEGWINWPQFIDFIRKSWNVWLG